MNRRNAIKTSIFGAAALAAMPKTLQAMATGTEFSKYDFGNNFKWGVATAAYQIEGAHNVDGKGPSIWDTFTHEKGKIKNKENGDVACDFYNRYYDDIAFIKQMNMQVNRFSTAWSRVLPQGTGSINQKGLDFYHKVIDRTLELGLEPWMTLYHWDLPQALQDKGGWENREVINWFSEYANLITKTYGDKVKNWMVLNEPMAFVPLGYMLGMHAPGKKGLGSFMAATHHAAMCQAEGGRIIKSNVANANIGTTFSCSWVDPKDQEEKNIEAAKKFNVLFNRLFIEPALGLGYPVQDLKLLNRLEKHIKQGDEEKLKFDFDFIGLQNYTRMVARKSLWPPIVWANQVKPEDRGVKPEDITEMGWEVYPEGMYKILKQFGAYKGVKEIIVTENGSAFPDVVESNAVHDKKRIQFFKDYLANVLKAKNEGVNISGYFVWTLMDNFEWAEGYHPRFGLVHVDFKTQQRIMKDSGLWFKEFLK
jgi:beta-glucosidase